MKIEPYLQNIASYLAFGVVYNSWLYLFNWEIAPYIIVTLLHGFGGHYLFRGSAITKRLLILLVPSSMFFFPLVTESQLSDMVRPVIVQSMLVGLLIAQFWEIILWVVKELKPERNSV